MSRKPVNKKPTRTDVLKTLAKGGERLLTRDQLLCLIPRGRGETWNAFLRNVMCAVVDTDKRVIRVKFLNESETVLRAPWGSLMSAK
ncbi:hypothetical protein Lfu02_55110 [Longispora fulva]|uniref:Uncharacterized protein n=1 Tax=Longispora fulva TaxID=619741 RepID=A0A8J7GBN0_9ACTN|nr:hypothetical protein [Longispora fulva]GIG61139.1 hypothetical protein Lfu02_55110 [Longispora fulva]